jgi:hypothetical protein
LKEIRRRSPVAPYTNELIADCFGDFWRKETGRVSVAAWDALPPEVTQVLSSFLSACDEALIQMKSLSSKTWMWQDRKAWNRWVVKLSDFAENNAFPTISSISRRGKASPFVRFVEQLQVSIPDKYRRSDHSLVALAQAIKRAREHTPQNTIAKNPRP